MADTRIMTFAWNAHAQPLCESLSAEVVARNRKGFFSLRGKCALPDFFPRIAALVREARPDLVAFSFFQSPKPGDYFFSEFLRDEMPRVGYSLVADDDMGGVGETELGLSRRYLHLAVYRRADFGGVRLRAGGQVDLVARTASCAASTFSRTVGALGFYLNVGGRNLLLLAEHLPFGAEALVRGRADPLLRQADLAKVNNCFNEIYRKLVLEAQPPPDFVVLMGELSYRLVNPAWGSAETAANFMKYAGEHDAAEMRKYWREMRDGNDELTAQIRKGLVYPLEEGVDGAGPAFLPTCDMRPGRPANCDPVSRPPGYPLAPGEQCFGRDPANAVLPSWCTRVLYKKVTTGPGAIAAEAYDRFDLGATLATASAGVYALIKISS